MRNRWLASLLLGALVLAPTASANPCALDEVSYQDRGEPEGPGGTGLAEDTRIAGGDQDSGLGGTGLGEEPDGLGGTGLGEEPDGLGGTGIIGTITGFGSICVNGLRIAYDASTPTEVNRAPARAESLQVGDVVAVQARQVGGELQASSIAVRQLVRGLVERIDSDERRVRVLGQSVELPAAWATDAFEVLLVGDPVAVAGHRRSDGRVVASRLTILEAPDVPSLIGTLELNEPGGPSIGGVAIEVEDPIDPSLANVQVLASGVWNAEQHRIEHAEIERAVVFDPRTKEISLGGYVEARGNSAVRIGGHRVETVRALRDRLRLDDYVVIRGKLTHSGAIRAVRIALDVRPPHHMLPRPPHSDGAADRPQIQRAPNKLQIERPADLPRVQLPPKLPPQFDTLRPERVKKLLQP